jgi:hypothetical protein
VNLHAEVDNSIAEWGEKVFNGGPVRKAKGRRGLTGLRIVQSREPPPIESAETRAHRVRSLLHGIAKRVPQVMVRISGGGKSIRHIKAHLSYISRNGRLPLEDQNGDKLLGQEELNDLAEEWQFGGFPLPENGDTRQAFNLILSMPAGTDPLALKQAVRVFASAEFSGFQYAMALHTQETDPDSEPSPHPHVHLCVKATGLDGIRLNPRKNDLQRWRERFASCLQERGIEATATKRMHRFQKHRGEKQALRHMRSRGEVPSKMKVSPKDLARIARAQLMEREMSLQYEELLSMLSSSTRSEDRGLASKLIDRVGKPINHLGRPAQLSPER